MSAAVSPRRLPFVWAWLVLVAGALTIGTRADARSPLSPWSLDLEDHPGLLSADVTAIDGDDRGRIWFATAEGGASRLDPRTGEWRTFADAATLGGTVVMDVRVAGDGHVWFGTLDLGIVRYAPDTGVWTRDWGERGPTCNGHEIIEARRGQIWIMCFGGDLHRYRPDADRWEQVGDDEWEPLRHVEDIAEDETGTIWVLSASHGLFKMDPETLDRTYAGTGNGGGRRETHIKAIHADGRGSVWLSGRTGGLARIDVLSGEYEFLAANPLPDSSLWVRDLHHSRDGRLWASTWGRGVRCFDPETRGWRDPSPAHGKGNFGAFLHEDGQGDLWAGSWSGNLAHYDREGGRWEARVATLIAADTPVTTVYEDRRGDLWFGTRGAGALHRVVATGEWSRLPMREDGTLGGGVGSAVALDPGGDLWFASYRVLSGLERATGVWGGGIHRYSPVDGAWRTYRQWSGVPGASAWTVEVTSGGHVLVGSIEDMVYLDRATGRFFVAGANSRESLRGIRSFAEDAEGRPWALNLGVGLLTASDGDSPHWREQSAEIFFGGHRMEWLSASPEGELWAGDRTGAVAVRRAGAEEWECCTSASAGRGRLRGLAFSATGATRWWWGEDGRVGYQAAGSSPVRWQEPPDETWVAHAHNPGIALVDDRGAAWVGYRRGLVRYDADGGRVDVFREQDGVGGWMADHGALDASGAIWLTDSSRAITMLVFDDAGPHRPLVLDGAPSPRASAALMGGHRGNDGLCWARPGGLTIAGAKDATQVPFSPVKEWYSAVDGAGDACWVGRLLSGVALVGADGRVTRFGMAEGLPDVRVLDVSQVPGADALAWVATDGGAALLDETRGLTVSITATEGSSPGSVDHVLALPDRSAVLVFNPFDPKWFADTSDAASRADLHLRRASSAGVIGDPIAIAAGEVRDLAVDGSGTVWLATDCGLFRLDRGSDEATSIPLPEGHANLTRIAADPAGGSDAVWLAADGADEFPARVLRYAPSEGSWRVLTAADGLPTAAWIDMLEVSPGGELTVMAGGRLVRGKAR